MSEMVAPIHETANFTGKHCVLAYSEGEPISGLYDTQEEAAVEKMRLRVNYPKATLGVWPTHSGLAEHRRSLVGVEDWSVTSFSVVADCYAEGVRAIGYPLSPAYATRKQAERALTALLEDYPNARISKQMFHCRNQEQWDAEIGSIVQP